MHMPVDQLRAAITTLHEHPHHLPDGVAEPIAAILTAAVKRGDQYNTVAHQEIAVRAPELALARALRNLNRSSR